MMPKTKLEKLVAGYRLPDITEAQKRWALSLSNSDNLTTYRRRKCDIIHFIIVTTHRGWQVIRHYYLYAYYSRGKMKNYEIFEVMRHWLKDGEYLFFSRSRARGYVNDAWLFCLPMELRRGSMGGGIKCDPREIGYTETKFVRVQKKYRYIPLELESRFGISLLYRAVNTSKYAETLMKNDVETFRWCCRNDFIHNKDKMAAVKIAKRYGYDFTTYDWVDHINNLIYLKKDVHNPKLVCPENFREVHSRFSTMVANKRMKRMNSIQRQRMIEEERRSLERLQREEERRQHENELKRTAVSEYERQRGMFFGIDIISGNIEIRPLQTLREFFEEGKELHHCVFANKYYDVREKPDSLILSAKVDGKRAETIEVSLSEGYVVQCRGSHNQNSEYHEQILSLMNENMYRITELNKMRV